MGDRLAEDEPPDQHEPNFRQLVESLPQLVWTCYSDGQWEYLSPQWVAYTGIDARQQLGTRWLEQLHPDDRGPTIDAWRRAVAAGTDFTCEFRIRRQDGACRWFNTRATRRLDRDGRTHKWFGTSTDVDDARRVHDTLVRENERLDNIIAKAPGAFFVMRREQGKPPTTPFVSPSLGELLGVPHDQLAEDAGWLQHLIHPDDFRIVMGILEIAEETGQPWHCEYRMILPGGNERWIDVYAIASGKSEGVSVWHGFMRDVTARRQLEAELRISREQLAVALSARQMGTWMRDFRTGASYFDPTMLRLWGRTQEELQAALAVGALPFVHPDDLGRLETEMYAVLQQGWDVLHFEFRILLPDLSVRWLASHGRVQRDDARKLVRMFGVAMDITDRKEREDDFRQSGKLEALSTLLSDIAYELDDLLLVMNESARLASRELPAGHRVRDQLDCILRQREGSTERDRRILDIRREKEPRREWIDVGLVVQEVFSLVRATTPATIEVRSSYAADAPLVAVDASQLHEVMVNLVTNAVYAIGGDRGEIDIVLDHLVVDADTAQATPGLRPGHFVRVSVRDTGMGMDTETMKRIFDPFFTTKPPGHGSGLGLSVVRRVAAAHGGAVSAHSEPGKGSVFRLYLPAASWRRGEENVRAGEVPTGNGERVLLVDDEVALVKLGARMLKRAGYEVTGQSDARRALEDFRANPQAFDVVITDVAMPGWSGFDLVREFRALRPDLPIVMTSGNLSTRDREQAVELGVRHLLQKPHSSDDMARVLHAALHGE